VTFDHFVTRICAAVSLCGVGEGGCGQGARQVPQVSQAEVKAARQRFWCWGRPGEYPVSDVIHPVCNILFHLVRMIVPNILHAQHLAVKVGMYDNKLCSVNIKRHGKRIMTGTSAPPRFCVQSWTSVLSYFSNQRSDFRAQLHSTAPLVH
jgi:hypothetical protein